jgi:polysaccharide deacetylase family protein (PEP-CTERM system associated)
MIAPENDNPANSTAGSAPRRPGAGGNAMTIDVEDYFQVQAFADHISRESWDAIPRRVERNIDRLLQLFADNEVSATFFSLGWIAERHPRMMRRIADAGHEMASHGYDHTRVHELTPDRFQDDVRRTKAIIEDATARPVLGYRAPTFSLGPRTAWAYAILEQEGYRYSSSIYPIRHDLYGAAAAPREPFPVASGRLWEIPLTTRRLFGQNFPCAGGGYFRLLPYWLSRLNLRHLNAADAPPCIFYMHPWEIDAEQPPVPGIGAKTRFRHYTNLKAMPARLERLLRDFRWSRMDHVFGDQVGVTAIDRAAVTPACDGTRD